MEKPSVKRTEFGQPAQDKDPMEWARLPGETRLMILERLALAKRGTASYASVCKEWQHVIEAENFRRLRVEVPCLNQLGRMVARPRALVKHIWLNIELPTYTCRSCSHTESGSWNSANSSIITKAIAKLLSILSTWETRAPADGLTLELSVQSPSDSRHWFKNWFFGAGQEKTMDHANEDISAWGQQRDDAARWHDPIHGWTNGRQQVICRSSGVRKWCLRRLYEPMRLLKCFDEAPEARAVTKFVLRRQVRRHFLQRDAGRLLCKLPRLDSIVYEPWRAWTRESSRSSDRSLRRLIKTFPSQKLKRLSIFEDFLDENYEIPLQRELFFGPHLERDVNTKLGATFARNSLNLEQLALSSIIDARHFFRACQPEWVWRNLRSLALTSPVLASRALSCTSTYKKASDLLQNAGKAALGMPRLKNMALWNTAKQEACVFLYYKDDGLSITWRGTWTLPLQSRVVKAWEKVAGRCLQVNHQRLGCAVFRSYGHAIRELNLPSGVVDPVSLWQIQMETPDFDLDGA